MFEKKHDSINQMISLTWLGNYANELGIDLEWLLEGADNFLASGRTLNEGPLFDGIYTEDEFWVHYEVVRKTTVREEDRENFFRCAC